MNENYIAELMARMEDSALGFDAHREAEALNDLAVMPELERLVKDVSKAAEIQDLAFILAGLGRNTKHPPLGSWYVQLLEKPRPSATTITSLIEYARIGGFQQFAAWVRPHLQHKSADVLSEAIEYLGQAGDADDMKAIGELLDRDCDGRCHPMYCIFAFEENGRREGIPYIERAVERHARGRKNIDKQICGYGENALARFAGKPVVGPGEGTIRRGKAAGEMDDDDDDDDDE